MGGRAHSGSAASANFVVCIAPSCSNVLAFGYEFGQPPAAPRAMQTVACVAMPSSAVTTPAAPRALQGKLCGNVLQCRGRTARRRCRELGRLRGLYGNAIVLSQHTGSAASPASCVANDAMPLSAASAPLTPRAT